MSAKTANFLGSDIKRPDGQGRIVIGKEFKDKMYSVRHQPNGDILLSPVVVMHEQEAWLFANQEALTSVKRGMEQAVRGETHDLGSFAEYATGEENDD